MIKKILLSTLVIILAFLFFAPDLFNRFVSKYAIDQYVTSKGGTLTTKRIAISWMGPQEIDQLHLQLKDGSVITADKISVNASLLSALTNQIPLVEVNASNVSAEFLNGSLQLHGMNVKATPENDNYRLSINGLTTSDNQKGQFLLEGLVNPSSQKILEASGTVDNLPIALIDKFMLKGEGDEAGWATAILGATANLNLQKRDDKILATVDTTTVKGKFSASISENGFELHNTSPLTFKASPQLFHLLRKDLSPTVLKKMEAIDEYTFTDIQLSTNETHDRYTGLIKGDLEKFPIAVNFTGVLKPFPALQIERGDIFTVDLEVPEDPFNRLREALYGNEAGDYLILTEPSKIRLKLEKFNLQTKEINADIKIDPMVTKNSESGELIHFPQMNGQFNRNEGGDFSLQLHAGNSDILATYKGSENLKVRATLNQFFYGIFSDLLTGNPLIRERIEATLGNDLSGEITFSTTSGDGYLNGTLKGNNGAVELSATVNDGFVTLRSPITIQTTMSPEFSRTVLGPLLPFLSTAQSSDQQVVLRIEPENFYAPLSNPDLTNVHIEQGSLQLGRVQLKNNGAIESMLDILKPAATGQLSVWFTPAYFNIQKGILTLHRMDMLVMQAYHVAVWGNLDFNARTVDMKLGLAGAALNKAFSMPSPLGSDEMVAFPLRGPFGNPSVDKARAITQITGLIAKLQGTPQSFIIGAFIQAAGKIGEDPIPSPTTQPFPWEGTIKPAGEPTPSGTPLKKPLKMIGKILGL